MDPKQLEPLQRLTYRDLVAQSIEHLEGLRERYRAASGSAERVPPEFPTHVQVQTLGGCNASCGMCPMSVPTIRSNQKGRIDPALFLKIVDECARHPDCKVVSPYLQNEPMLDTTLETKVRAIKERSGGRLSARIVTNGSLLSRDRAVALLDAGIDVISVSLNAHSKEAYGLVMPGLDFDETVSNIETLLALDTSHTLVLLTFMVTSDNEHEVQEAIDYWSSRGVMCGAFGLGTMSGTVENFEALRASSTKAHPKECFVPMEATAILANGDMLLCCSDWGRTVSYANVATHDIYDVWHSPRLSEIRRNALHGIFEEPACDKCLGQTKTLDNLEYAGGPGGNTL